MSGFDSVFCRGCGLSLQKCDEERQALGLCGGCEGNKGLYDEIDGLKKRVEELKTKLALKTDHHDMDGLALATLRKDMQVLFDAVDPCGNCNNPACRTALKMAQKHNLQGRSLLDPKKGYHD